MYNGSCFAIETMCDFLISCYLQGYVFCISASWMECLTSISFWNTFLALQWFLVSCNFLVSGRFCSLNRSTLDKSISSETNRGSRTIRTIAPWLSEFLMHHEVFWFLKCNFVHSFLSCTNYFQTFFVNWFGPRWNGWVIIIWYKGLMHPCEKY